MARDFLDALKSLQDALDKGDEPDQSLLDRIEQDADALGKQIDGAGDPNALVQSLATVASLATSIIAPALTPVVAAGAKLAEAMVGGPAGVAPPPAIGALGDKLKALAEKLGATDGALAGKLGDLAEQLTSGKLPQSVLDKLGLTADDPGTQEALQALLSPPKPAAPPPAQATAKADLELPAPALGAPAAPSAAPAGEAGAPVAKPGPEKVAGVQAGPSAAHQGQAKSDDVTAPNFTIEAAPDAPNASAAASPQPQPATSATQASAAPRVLPTAYSTPQVNLPQVGFEIARQIQNGTSRFEIRLDPPELGRIDVRMHVDGAGNVHARLTVERSETLDLFQRDQRGLERALQQAGVDAGKTNLEFSLRQGPFERPQQAHWTPASMAGVSSAGDPEASAPTVTLYRGIASPGGVNIFV